MSLKKRSTPTNLSRRKFIQSTALLSISQGLAADPYVSILKGVFDHEQDASPYTVTCDILRPSDLLYLRYYFFNAVFTGNKIIKRIETDDLFVYIKTPSQHVAEELETNIEQVRNRRDFDNRRKRSFLAGSSWLAFRVNSGSVPMHTTEESLLDWKKHFQLITVDDFARRANGVRTNYRTTIAAIKNALELEHTNSREAEKSIPALQLTFNQHVLRNTSLEASAQETKRKLSETLFKAKRFDETSFILNQNVPGPAVKWPLTKFELPYKMYLTPIGRPLHDNNDYHRILGEYSFIHPNTRREEFSDSKAGVTIVKPWQNELGFIDDNNVVSPPRFKVAHWENQSDTDGDTCTELLPAPIHREELYNLTMLQDFDRDVVTEFLKVGALGGSTFLKYSHHEPTVELADGSKLQYTTVGWEQDVKLARDNYVSITFRAVDVFTGIKLLVSIVSQRRYLHGVSFLEKRYYVTHAEKQKEYESGIVISRIPFRKLIPKTQGAFFSPISPSVIGCTHSYVVAEEGTTGFDCKKVLPFDYIGIDKSGTEHPLMLKIVFIPAESYTITEGEYCYGSPPTCYRNGGPPIDIKHIGFLDPTRRLGYQGPGDEATLCGPSTNYRFQIKRNFDKTNRLTVQDDLVRLRKHVAEYADCYQTQVEGDLTFARIDKLTNGTDEAAETAINRNSASATFNTRAMLLFSDVQRSDAAVDMFTDDFPLLPRMEEADVIVSQVDQIEGRTKFRKVAYAGSYFAGNTHLDEPNDQNRSKLLLRLIKRKNGAPEQYEEDPIFELFAKNYKNAGALVDPGIPISHISVRDQGIIFNESHNSSSNALLNHTDTDSIVAVKSSSVFGELNAQIMGIPLLDIIGEVLPVKDLPVFNYLREAEESIEKFENLTTTYRHYYNLWKTEYSALKNSVFELGERLANADNELKELAKNEARAWLDELLSQYASSNLFTYQFAFVRGALDAGYFVNVLKPIRDKLGTQLDDAIRAILQVQATLGASNTVPNENEPELMAKAITNLLTIGAELPTTEHDFKFKESVKIYTIYYIVQNPDVRLAAVVSAAAKLTDLPERLQPLYRQLMDALTEATFFSYPHAAEQAANIADRARTARIEAAGVIKATVDSVPLFSPNDFSNTIAAAQELATIYQSYHQLYQHLKIGHYEKLAAQLRTSISGLEELEQTLVAEMAERVEQLTITSTQPTLEAYLKIKAQYDRLKDGLGEKLREVINIDGKLLSEYDRHIAAIVRTPKNQEFTLKDQITRTFDSYYSLVKELDSAFEDKFKQTSQIRATLEENETKLKYFVRHKIDVLETELRENRDELIQRYGERGSQTYNDIKDRITELNGIVSKLREGSHQKLNYRFTTSNFRKASVGGLIEFIPERTDLTVDVNYDIQFAIEEFARAPRIVRQDYSTYSALRNFKVSFLKLISIDFDRVVFRTGSSVKDDFEVKIRDVQFAGCLSFVQAFQRYLSALSDNLAFQVTTSEARIGYTYALPDFSAGYFNFFNFNIGATLTLPFDPNRSLQLQFGLGSEKSKFGLTVSGIFGGQGYFNLIVEPKRGVVGMVVVFEFGAIFHLNLLGIVQGTAYLVAGIFIKRYAGNYEVRGYILCVGKFSIIGLFSAGVSFYLGLHGNGSILKGECAVTVSKRFSSFFKISVTCRMRKTMRGADRNETQKSLALHKFATFEERAIVEVIDGNLGRATFYSDQGIFLSFNAGAESTRKSYIAAIVKDGADEVTVDVGTAENIRTRKALYLVDVDLKDLRTFGNLMFEIREGDSRVLQQPIYVADINGPLEEQETTKKGLHSSGFVAREISAKEYYRSYYQKL